MVKRGYAVRIFTVDYAENSCDFDMKEVKSFSESALDRARVMYEYQVQQLHWSLQHRTNLGIEKNAALIVQLFDNTEGFELQEELL